MHLEEILQLPVYKRLSRLLGEKHPVLINLRIELSRNGRVHKEYMPYFYTGDDLYICIHWASTSQGFGYWQDISTSLVPLYKYSYL